MQITQKLLNRHIDSLFDMITESYQPDEIIGIKNGGFYLSKPLATLMNKKHNEIHVSFYDDKKGLEKPRIAEFIELNKNKKYLICEDLIDRGYTVKLVREHYKGFNIKIATILQNKKATEKADFFADYYNGKWVDFPDDIAK